MITNYILNVSGLLATNTGECLDVVNKVDALYSNAWTQITLIFAIAFGVIPILFQMRWNEMKKELQKDIASGNKNFDNKIDEVDRKILTNDERLSDKMQEFDRKIEEQKRQLQNETEEIKKQWNNNFTEISKIMDSLTNLVSDSIKRTYEADHKILDFNQKIERQKTELELKVAEGEKNIAELISKTVELTEEKLTVAKQISKEYSKLNFIFSSNLSNVGTKKSLITGIIARAECFLELNEISGVNLCIPVLLLILKNVKDLDLNEMLYKDKNLKYYVKKWMEDERLSKNDALAKVFEQIDSKK